MSELSLRALQIATGQIGVHEQPKSSNRGPEVNQYLESVGLSPGNYWCAAFVHWCFLHAALQLKSMNPVPRTGLCIDMLHKTPANKQFHNPEPGDIFILDFGKGHGHTGIVKEVNGNKFRAVEGNSNDDGSHNGEEVCVPKWRGIDSVRAFLRY